MAELLEAVKNFYDRKGTADGDDRATGVDDGGSEALSKEIFTEFKPSSISRGLPHPGSVSEATSLSAIQLPATTYPLFDSISDDVVDNGKLSQLQLESVLYACTKHLTFLPSGQRAGFFIGDGAGVGKGRQIAGIILDNYARGRKRAVWLSTSSDLHHDAERDLKALGLHLQVVNNCQTLDRETRATGLAKDFQEGVLFMTYSTLISNIKGKSRLQQVMDWVGGPDFSGPLVLDECHKAKNFLPGKEKQSTKVASAVLELQKALPKARVVYCSATGVSEVQNMAYMERLGLWGPGSAFPNFEAFLDSMKRRGVTFLEMLSMEMKAEGYYVARGLSFKDAEFMELECPLTPEQEQTYNDAVHLWKDLRARIVDALDATNTNSREVWKSFWSAQQRFFKLLCISVKMPCVIKEAQQALEEGHSVVIGLQSTGEAAADAMGLEPGLVCGFVSATKELLQRFVATHFPTRLVPPQGEPDLHEEVESCVAAKSVLLQRIQQLELPPTFLDELVDKLGGPGCVAEMTGRKGHIVRNAQGRGVYSLRAKPDSQEMDSLNVNEMAAFMKGKKLVAIVSDAASTGISLHASADAANQRRRVHLTVELPWSADKAIQQLGRSHRSNQTSAPIFKLVLSSLGGERRFAAAVARRLQSLGALTRGDRRAASGIDLSESNLDSPLGRKSLKRMYDCIVLESCNLPAGVTLPAVLAGCDPAEIAEVLKHIPDPARITEEDLDATVHKLHVRIRSFLDMMSIGLGQEKRRNDTVAENTSTEVPGTSSKDMGDVRRFLSRLLGVEVARQNLLFNYFVSTLAAEIKAAKEEGRYSEGVSDLHVSDLAELPQPQVVWTDRHSELETLRTDLVTDRGISWDVALKTLEHERFSPGDASGFCISRRPMFGRTMVVLAVQKSAKGNVFDIRRPNTGVSFFDMEEDELRQKYQRVDPEVAKDVWVDVYEDSKHSCTHGHKCQQGRDCTFGKRMVAVSILSGSIVRVWGVLEMVLQRHELVLSKAERTMRVVRVEFPSGDRLIGVRYPVGLIPEVVAILSSAQTMTNPTAAVGQHERPTQLSGEALQAAALGAGGAMRSEPVSPVNAKFLSRAFRHAACRRYTRWDLDTDRLRRARKTVLDFFKPLAGGARAAGPSPKATVQRNTRNGPEEGIARFLQGRDAAPQQRAKSAAQAPIALSDSSDGEEAPRKRRRSDGKEGRDTTEAERTHKLGRAEARATECEPASSAMKCEVPGSDGNCHVDAATRTAAGRGAAMKPKEDPAGGHVAPNRQHPLTEGDGKLNRQQAARQEGGEKLSAAKRGRAGQPEGEHVDRLLALGFKADEAARALKITNGDVERAAEWLYMGT